MRVQRQLTSLVLLLGCGEPEPPKKREPIPLPPIDAMVAREPRMNEARPVDAAVSVDAARRDDPSAAAKAAYPELLDLRTRWIYEVVEGSSLAKLQPVRDAPRIFGTMAVQDEDGVTVARMTTRPEGGKIKMHLAATTNRTFRIAYDAAGIRQLAALTGPATDTVNIRGLTFPIATDAPVTIKRDARSGRVEIKIRKQRMRIANKAREVLVADTTIDEERYDAKSYELFAYAPKLGPALLCAATLERDFRLCLRLVDTDERRCAVAAKQLCGGADATICDAVLLELLRDPTTGEPRLSSDAEKLCDGYLNNPAEMERMKNAITARP